MAEFKKTYKNGTIESTLTFREMEFTETMGEWENGIRKGNTACIETQIEKHFADDEDIEEIKEALEDFETESDDDIEQALERLSEFE